MPDFGDQLNISDTYRLSPSTGVPKTRSAPPPIGGTTIQPGAARGYRVGGAMAPSRGYAAYPGEAAAHTAHAAEQRLPGMIGQQPPLSTPGRFPARAPQFPMPSAPVHGANYDPVSAFEAMRPRAIEGGAVSPSLPPAPPRPTGHPFPPDALANDLHATASRYVAAGGRPTAAAELGPLGRGVAAMGEDAILGPKFSFSPRHLGQGLGIGLGAAAVNDPNAAVDAATHPMQTMRALGGLPGQAYQALVNPQGTWVPGFTEGLTRLFTGDVGGAEALGAVDSGAAMGVGRAGMRMGDTLRRYGSQFGQGNLARDLGAGLNVIKNKISDAYYDPGGGFGR